ARQSQLASIESVEDVVDPERPESAIGVPEVIPGAAPSKPRGTERSRGQKGKRRKRARRRWFGRLTGVAGYVSRALGEIYNVQQSDRSDSSKSTSILSAST